MKLVIGVLLAGAIALGTASPATAAGCDDDVAVAAARAEVAAQCPCDGFPNHGQYVRCANGVARDLVRAELLPRSCRGAVTRCAARSTCGKPGFVTCCRTDRRGKTRCSTKRSAEQCKAPKDGSACIGVQPSCCDACEDGGCVGPTPTAPPPTPTPAPTETPPPTPTPPPGSASAAFVLDVPSLLR